MSLTRPQVTFVRIMLLMSFVAITYLATTSGSYPSVLSISDKLNHLAAFFTLAFMADFSFPDSGFDWWKVTPLLVYAISIEGGQYFLPYRSADLLDIAADGIGILLYALTVPVLKRLPILKRRWERT